MKISSLEIKEIKVIDLGTFQYPKFNKEKGIYLWIYKGKFPRIIYVGTALGESGFESRLTTEKKDIEKGKAFLLRTKSDDIYYDRSLIADSKKEYAELYKNRRLWIPGVSKLEYFSETQINFDKEWKSFAMKYQGMIALVGLVLPNKAVSLLLETAIQKFLARKYKLTYYSLKANSSWLGQRSSSLYQDDLSIKLEFDKETYNTIKYKDLLYEIQKM